MTDDTRLGVQAQQHENTWNDRGKCCGYIIPRLFIGMRGWKLGDNSWGSPQSRFPEGFHHGDSSHGGSIGEKRSTEEGASSLTYDQCEMNEQSSKGNSTLITRCHCHVVVFIIGKQKGEDDLVSRAYMTRTRLLNVGVISFVLEDPIGFTEPQ